jgi:succinyl-diaminopimelate desuccinylase
MPPYFCDHDNGTSPFKHNLKKAIKNVTGLNPKVSLSGGTSDGRFFAAADCQVIEMGIPCLTAHQVDERVEVKELETLEKIYCQLLEDILL